MKNNSCPNTYFAREVTGYVELLLSADGLLCSLEKAYSAGSDRALAVSRKLDEVIAGLMKKRETVSQILLADSTFN